jgi:hypothetical protein
MLPTVFRPLTWVTAGLAAAAAAVAVAADRPPASPAATVGPAPRTVEAAEADNPRVEPGLVRWHPTFADAQTAARKSGRPVLLFHMMGQLDRQFC